MFGYESSLTLIEKRSRSSNHLYIYQKNESSILYL